MSVPLCLLILEDSFDDTELLLEELRQTGFEPNWQCVDTEPDFLAGLHEGLDVILADYRLPQFSVMRALQLLQENGLDIPLIVITGSISEEVAVECIKQGAADYLLKDRLVRLGQAIRHALLQRSLRQEKRQAEAALQQSEARNRALLNAIPDLMFRVSKDGIFLDFKPAKDTKLALLDSKCLGKKVYEVLPTDVAQPILDCVQRTLQTGNVQMLEYQLLLNGDRRDYEARIVVSGETEALAIVRDITERKQVEEQLVHNALHDALTGLPNRALFMESLRRAIEYCKRHQNYLFAVLFLDLDRFKLINDSLGHNLGDQFLITTAQKFKKCLRPTDTVARLGGDEFTILLEGINDVSDAVHIAERIQAQLILPVKLGTQEVFTTASIGITLSTVGYDYPEDCVRDADMAMYGAKALGKARYEITNLVWKSQQRE